MEQEKIYQENGEGTLSEFTNATPSVRRLASDIERGLGDLSAEADNEEIRDKLTKMAGKASTLTKELRRLQITDPGAENSEQEDLGIEAISEYIKPHIVAGLDMYNRRLYLGEGDATGIDLGGANDEWDYGLCNGDLWYTLVLNQRGKERFTSQDLWQLTYDEDTYDEDVMKHFREWCNNVIYNGQPVVDYDEHAETYSIPDYEISFEYTNETGRKDFFILPDGKYFQGRTAAVARDLMATLETREWVSSKDLQEKYGSRNGGANSALQQISQAIRIIKERLPSGFVLDDKWANIESREGHRRMYYQMRRVDTNNESPHNEP